MVDVVIPSANRAIPRSPADDQPHCGQGTRPVVRGGAEDMLELGPVTAKLCVLATRENAPFPHFESEQLADLGTSIQRQIASSRMEETMNAATALGLLILVTWGSAQAQVSSLPAPHSAT